MAFKDHHAKYKDDDSPSVEGQIRWLQKQGFQQHQIEQAMIMVYDHLEKGKIPQRWEKISRETGGKEVVERRFLSADSKRPGKEWENRPIKNGFELDQFLLETAKQFRTIELTQAIENLEKFKSKLESDWKENILSKVPWYKRLFGIKRALKAEESDIEEE